VTTRFSRPIHTVAIALTGTTPATLDPTSLDVIGARLTRDTDGVDEHPVAVSIGTTSVLVYGLVPDRDATSVSVEVTAGSAWTVTGVVGSDLPPDELARMIAARGLAAATAKVLAVSGPGCTLTWAAPQATPPRRPRSSRPRKGTTR